MAKSNITLYKTDLAPNLNYIIESIGDYLHTCSSQEIGEVRYIEPKLQQTIILKCDQSLLHTGLNYNYAKVTTRDSTGPIITNFYFVQSLEWASRKTIRVQLMLDTLNTLSSDYITRHCDDRTAIVREHRDRWQKQSDGSIVAKVDQYDEGLNVTKEVQKTRKELTSDLIFWCQISVNATTPDITDTHPYKSLICYDHKKLWLSGGVGTDTYRVPADGKAHYFLEGTITYANQTFTIGSSTSAKDDLVGTLRLVKVSPSEVIKVYCTGDSFPYSFLKIVKETYSLPMPVMKNVRRDYYETYNYATFENSHNLDRVPFLSYQEINVGKYAPQYVAGMEDNLDRTQSYLMQINPIPAVNISTKAIFIEGFNMLMLTKTDWQIARLNLSRNTLDKTPALADSYDYKQETKLLHPSITDSTINYQDSVLFTLDWSRATGDITITEWMGLDDTNTGLLKMRAAATNYQLLSQYELITYTTNKYNVPIFTNQWTDYVRTGYNYDLAERNRQKTLQSIQMGLSIASATVGGLNTITGVGKAIYNGAQGARSAASNYVAGAAYEKLADIGADYAYNYIGYDKNKGAYTIHAELDDFASQLPEMDGASKYADWTYSRKELGINRGRQLLGALKAGASSFEGNKLGNMITTQALGQASSAYTAYSSIQSAAATYENNLQVKAQSKTAIMGNTTSYKLALDNILTYEEWQPRENVLKDIAKTFYLTGYNHPVIEKPNVKSRTWFNYIQCSPHWDIIALNNTNPLWLVDMTERLNEGVTVFHNNNKQWDLNQTKANWETSIM